MKKEIILKILVIIICTLVLLGLDYVCVELRVKQELDLTTTYIASHDISPRSIITEEDLIETRIPSAYLLDHAVNEKENIIGKYTEIQGMIPAGSVFYDSMLYEEKDLPDYPSAQLREGQSAFTLETDLARLGGTVVPGQRVDIYAAMNRRDGSALTGCLIENARVIAIKDHKGLDIDDEESDGTPYLSVLAVNQEDLKYLSAAEEMGDIRLFPSSSTYDDKKEARLVKEGEIYAYLSQMDTSS